MFVQRYEPDVFAGGMVLRWRRILIRRLVSRCGISTVVPSVFIDNLLPPG